MSTTELIPAPEYGALEQSRFMPVMSIETAVQRRDVIVMAVARLMKLDQDYGKIPGTAKPTLLQPGADKLNNLFGLVPRFVIDRDEDWTGERHGGEAFFSYSVTCKLYRNDYLMGEGCGSCNSWESKYRYRKSERVCPSCGKDSIIKGKQEYGGGWLCFPKKGGCGAKFKDKDAAIEGQQTGRIPNPDVFDLVNTVLKMANKRAKIAATLNATSAHEFFTQDVEDMAHAYEEVMNEQNQTQARKEVLDRKLAGINARKEPVADAQIAEEPRAEPSLLDEMLATFKAAPAIDSAFAQMKEHFVPMFGQEVFDRVMEEGGLGPGQTRTIGKAKKTYAALWSMYQAEKAKIDALPVEDEQ